MSRDRSGGRWVFLSGLNGRKDAFASGHQPVL